MAGIQNFKPILLGDRGRSLVEAASAAAEDTRAHEEKSQVDELKEIKDHSGEVKDQRFPHRSHISSIILQSSEIRYTLQESEIKDQFTCFKDQRSHRSVSVDECQRNEACGTPEKSER